MLEMAHLMETLPSGLPGRIRRSLIVSKFLSKKQGQTEGIYRGPISIVLGVADLYLEHLRAHSGCEMNMKEE